MTSNIVRSLTFLIISIHAKHLDPTKFNQSEIWTVEAVNHNKNLFFHSVFQLKELAYCLLFKIGCVKHDRAPQLEMQVFYQSVSHPLFSMIGPVAASTFIYPLDHEKDKECPLTERLNFLYTDYLNVVVLHTTFEKEKDS